jgi:DNA-binding IclR family transcriptional regulator
MSQVPAATRALRVLRFLAGQPDPVPLDRIMRACELPRSTTYHLLNVMEEEGFVVHLADEHRFGLGPAAFELGSGYARQEPLQRIARRPLADLVDRVAHSAHLAILHGREVLYVVEERAPGRPPLVTDVGVRLPAHLTASGRAILARLPASQVRALYPSAAEFVERHGRGSGTAAGRPRRARCGPCSPTPGSAGTPSRTVRSRPGSPAWRSPCSTTTSTRSPPWR